MTTKYNVRDHKGRFTEAFWKVGGNRSGKKKGRIESGSEGGESQIFSTDQKEEGKET